MPHAANPTLRKDILNAVLQIVEEKSTSGLTMRAVAGALGYSATAIYQHFKSKEELSLALKIKAGDLLSQYMVRARQEPTARGTTLPDGPAVYPFWLRKSNLLSTHFSGHQPRPQLQPLTN